MRRIVAKTILAVAALAVVTLIGILVYHMPGQVRLVLGGAVALSSGLVWALFEVLELND
jgi:hypothetical protein